MKFPLTCAQCLQEGFPNFSSLSMFEYNDDGRYETSCNKGHVSIIILQQQKFEILFDIGANAIIDGYYREAVSSFTSSLERFYEFFIKVICSTKQIELNQFREAWKAVANQSERQFGAFIFIYLTEFGSNPAVMSRQNIEFRNSVIHKGKIPNKQEAISYGQAVLDQVRPLLKKLNQNYEEGVHQTVSQHLTDSSKNEDKKFVNSTLSISTILSIFNREPPYDCQTLEEALVSLSQQPFR